MQVVNRTPGAKWIDRTGTRTKNGFEILSFAGFGVSADGTETSFSVWNVRCPGCSRELQMWGTGLDRNKSCGCLDDRVRDALHHKMRRAWYLQKQHNRLGPEWQTFEQFESDLRQEWESIKSAKLLMRDNTKPLGPKNYLLLQRESTGRQAWTKSKVYTICGQQWTKGKIAELLGVSRQRVHQMSDTLIIERMTQALSTAANQDSAV